MTSTDERFRPVNAYKAPTVRSMWPDMYRRIVQHKYFPHALILIANIKARNLEQPVNMGCIWAHEFPRRRAEAHGPPG